MILLITKRLIPVWPLQGTRKVFNVCEHLILHDVESLLITFVNTFFQKEPNCNM